MLTKCQIRRKSELHHRLFTVHTKEDRCLGIRHRVSPEETKEFLRLSALSHQAYYQYTTLCALQGMLESGRIHLSLVESLNDLLECKAGTIGNRSYVVSFGFGHVENIAMWWMYGFRGDVSGTAVRLRFDGAAVQKWAKRLQIPRTRKALADQICLHSEDGQEIKGRLPCPVESVSFHDILYQYGKGEEGKTGRRSGSVFWNGQIAGESRCAAFSNVLSCPCFSSYAKEIAWAYEREVRLVVTLSEPHPEIGRISIPFESVLSTLSITAGHDQNGNERSCNAVIQGISGCKLSSSLKLEKTWAELVRPSKYPVRFPKVKKDH